MNSEIVLGKIASAADDLVRLNQISGRDSQSCVQSESVALCSLQFKADPMVFGTALGAQDHRLAFKIFNHNVNSPIIEQVAEGHAPADLGNLNGRTRKFADVLKRSIALVQKQEFGLEIFYASMDARYLRVHVAVGHKEIEPAIVVEVKEAIAPAHVRCGGRGNLRGIGHIGEIHVAIVAI